MHTTDVTIISVARVDISISLTQPLRSWAILQSMSVLYPQLLTELNFRCKYTSRAHSKIHWVIRLTNTTTTNWSHTWWLSPTPASHHPVPKLELRPWLLLTKIERHPYPNILRCCSSPLLISWIVTGMRLSTLRWTSRMLHSNNFTSLTKRQSWRNISPPYAGWIPEGKKRCAQARCGFFTLHCSAFAVQNTTLWEKIGQSSINHQILSSGCLQCTRMWTKKLEPSYRVGRSWNIEFPRKKIQTYDLIEHQTQKTNNTLPFLVRSSLPRAVLTLVETQENTMCRIIFRQSVESDRFYVIQTFCYCCNYSKTNTYSFVPSLIGKISTISIRQTTTV